MKYTYDLYEPDPNMPGTERRIETTTRPEEIDEYYLKKGGHVRITDNERNIVVSIITSKKDLDEWLSQEDHRTSIRNQHIDEPLRSVVNEIAQTSAFTRSNDKWDPFDPKETEVQMKREVHPPLYAPMTAIKETKDAINPKHYQDFVELELGGFGPVTFQWLELEFRKPQFRNNPEAIKGALLFQIDKYLGRLGSKDSTVQELKKAKWYLEYLIAFESNGNFPLFVKDVERWNNNEKEKI